MLNRILSKKIKSPLSLRGAFPHVIARERSDRSNLNHSGFSLIELMVAVAVLALAIFGIFLAFTTGFQGMADARDRTVATNYAQEAMEDIRNMDFDQIITKSRAFIIGTKFEREVIVQSSTNLKKVTTKVYWKDRNGIWKMVETDTIVQFVETTAGTPTKILLYANPYNVLTENDVDTPINEKESIITAVIKDDKGNNVKAPAFNITFSIVGGGSLSPNTFTSIDGKATTTFTSGTEAGEVTITASSVGLTSDSITIQVTDPNKPVKINLTADKMFMTATTSSISTITATIVNAGGVTVTEAIEQVEITFSVSGPGTLSTPTTKTTVSGGTTIDLTSNGNPGTITVTASASGLEPGVINIITGGKIYLSASSINVPVNETSKITITTKDMNGAPMKYIGTIDLSVGGDGFGYLSPSSVTFDGTTSSKTVIFTASEIGEVIINSEDVSVPGILTPENDLILTVIPELNPDHIKVDAVPSSIPTGGNENNTSIITARVENEFYIPITSYINDITFTTTAGSFSPIDDTVKSITLSNGNENYNDGMATLKLYSSNVAETAIISVTSIYDGETISGNTRVGFYSEADHIDLIAIPQSILSGGGTQGTCNIIATVKDGTTIVSSYNGPVTFTIVAGFPNGIKFISTNQSNITINAIGGVATIVVQSKNWVGNAKIKASASEGLPKTLDAEVLIPVVANKNLEIFMLYKNESTNFIKYYYPEDGLLKGSWSAVDIYGKFCVDSDNNLYILDGSYIQKKNSRGDPLLRSETIAENSYSINIGPNGYIYFTQNIGDKYYINKINPNTLVVEDILNLTENKIYYGFAIDSDANIYIHNFTEQTIEKWNFINGFTELDIDLSYNYEFSELAIAGDYVTGYYIGGVGEVAGEREAFKILKDFSSSEITPPLTGMVNPLYISSIGGDFLFSGLDDANQIVYGRYGTDGSPKWNHTIPKENEIPFSDCIIGAYPF